MLKGLNEGVEVILKQEGANWELSFKGRIEIKDAYLNKNKKIERDKDKTINFKTPFLLE